MATEHATAEQFTTWAARAKEMTDAALCYSIRDCHQAAKAMASFNPIKEGYYRDEASVYHQELSRRLAA
jgi:hypothetical protein